MITSIVIQLEREGVKITYLKKMRSFYKNDIRENLHKCRIKEVIYGGVFTYYDEGMDFTLSLESGSKITIDNRNMQEHALAS